MDATAAPAPISPGLFKPYRARPPWKAADVDYPVGRTDTNPPIHWTDAKVGGAILAIDKNHGRIDVGSGTIAGIDLTTAWLYIPQDRLNVTATIDQCVVGPSPVFAAILSQAPFSAVTIRRTTFTGCTPGQSTYIRLGPGNHLVELNRILDPSQHVAELNGKVHYECRDNYIRGAAVWPAHENHLDMANIQGAALFYRNTVERFTPGGAEGPQFYSNFGGALDFARCCDNTLIARRYPGYDPAVPTMSWLVHGDKNIKDALCANNWYDASGAYGFSYPEQYGGFSAAQLRGNVDLNNPTGASAP